VAFQVAKARRDVLAHVMLFATTRAASKIRLHYAMNGPETLEDLQARIITRLFQRIVSAKRAAFIKGRFGRIAFSFIFRGIKPAIGARDVAVAEYLLDTFKVQLAAAAAHAEAAEKLAREEESARAAATNLAHDEQVDLAFPLTTVVEESDELQHQQDDDAVDLNSVPIPKELKRFLVYGLVTISDVWELVKQMAFAARCDLSLLEECLHSSSTTLKRAFVDEYIRSQSWPVKVEKKLERKRGKGGIKKATVGGGGKNNPSRSVASTTSNSKGKKIISSSTSNIINNSSKAALNATAVKAPSSSSTSSAATIAKKQNTTLVAATKTLQTTAINNVPDASPPESTAARGDDNVGGTKFDASRKEDETRKPEVNSSSTIKTDAIHIVDRQKTLGKALFSSSIPSALIDRPLMNAVAVSTPQLHQKENEMASDWAAQSRVQHDLMPTAPPLQTCEEGLKPKSLNQHRPIKFASTSETPQNN